MADFVNHRIDEAGLAWSRGAVDGVIPINRLVDQDLDVCPTVVEAAVADLRGEGARHGHAIEVEEVNRAGRGQGALRVFRRLHLGVDDDRYCALQHQHLRPRGHRRLLNSSRAMITSESAYWRDRRGVPRSRPVSRSSRSRMATTSTPGRSAYEVSPG